MQATSNLGLKKPDYADGADIAVLNENMDILDEKVGKEDISQKKSYAYKVGGFENIDDMLEYDTLIQLFSTMRAAIAKNRRLIDTKGSFIVAATAPTNTAMLWVDTASGGVMKYHDGTTWKPIKAVWG